MLLLPLPPETLIACHLDAKDLPAVAEARALALEHAGRVEAAPILPKLAKTFYESPYTAPPPLGTGPVRIAGDFL